MNPVVNTSINQSAVVALKYVVIAARYKNQWILVRHRDRQTWEIPGGHIEPGELPENAARRELYEETGAEQFDLNHVSTYSVELDGKTSFGKLYFADVKQIGRIPVSEIAESALFDALPDNLTYPLIQPILFNRILLFLNQLQHSQ